MQTACRAVENFLAALRALKVPQGRVELRAEFCHEQRNLRGAFAGRAASAAGGPEPVAASCPDGILPIGGGVRFQLTLPAGGSPYLFNLGSSGACAQLYPAFGPPSPPRAPGAVLSLPSCDSWYRVTGPATSFSGSPDRLLALVFPAPRLFTIADLDPRLTQRFAARGPGFAGAPRLSQPSLFTLEPDQWDYALLEFATS